MKNIFKLSAVLCITVLLGVTTAHALKTDRDQPVDIEADDIEFDLKKGTRTFTDNVLAVQGSLRLKADKVFAVYKKDVVDNVTAWGSLARFKQRPDDKPYDVEGWAQKIFVNQSDNTITLTGEAALKQGPDTARGDSIVYNMADDTLQIKGSGGLGLQNDNVAVNTPRTIVDDFTDDAQGPDLPAKSAQTNSDESSPQRTTSGRSRLILKPKKKHVKQDDEHS